MPSLLCSSVQNFALGKGDEEVITTLQSFAKTVGEVSPMFSVLLLCLCVPVYASAPFAEERDDELLNIQWMVLYLTKDVAPVLP